MTVGRNEPCPCGSGKKYKKCCLHSDEEKARQTSTSRSTPLHGAAEMLDEDEQHVCASCGEPGHVVHDAAEGARWDAFWLHLESATVDEKIAIVRECVETEPDFDGELAFDLINTVQQSLRDVGRFDEIEALLALIAERHPEAYEDEADWFNIWRVEDALLAPGRDLITPLVVLSRDHRAHDGRYEMLVDWIRYRGQADALVAAAKAAATTETDGDGGDGDDDPEPDDDHQDDDDEDDHEQRYEDQGQEDDNALPSVAAVARIGELLDESNDLAPDDERVATALSPLAEATIERMRDGIARLTGRVTDAFRAADLVASSPEARARQQALGWEFRRWLRARGWSLLRADLATVAILRLAFPQQVNPPRRSHSSGAAPPRPLLPTENRALSAVKSCFRDYPFQAHRAAALAAALRWWPEFLVEKALVERTAATRFMSAWIASRDRIAALFLEHGTDRALADDVRTTLAAGGASGAHSDDAGSDPTARR